MLTNSQGQQNLLDSYPNYKSFIEEYSPNRLSFVYDKIQTIEESVSEERTCIQDLEVFAPETSIRYLEEWLEFLNKFSNINKPITAKEPVAQLIFVKYKHLYLSDLKLIFEWLMCGYFGPFYGSVDAQRIISSFEKYSQRRWLVMKEKSNELNRMLEEYMTPKIKEVKIEIENKIFKKYEEEGILFNLKDFEKEVASLLRDEYPQFQKMEEEYIQQLKANKK